MTPPLLASLYMILHLHNMRKHDQVLYRFCQLRREAMSLIREHNFNLTKEDYVALREITEVTSATIHDYNRCKIYLFNFRRLLRTIRQIENLEPKINKGRALKGQIKGLRNRFGDAMVFAFFTFTPFLKYETALRVFTGALMALTKVGVGKARRVIEVLSWLEAERRTPTFS